MEIGYDEVEGCSFFPERYAVEIASQRILEGDKLGNPSWLSLVAA